MIHSFASCAVCWGHFAEAQLPNQLLTSNYIERRFNVMYLLPSELANLSPPPPPQPAINFLGFGSECPAVPHSLVCYESLNHLRPVQMYRIVRKPVRPIHHRHPARSPSFSIPVCSKLSATVPYTYHLPQFWLRGDAQLLINRLSTSDWLPFTLLQSMLL